MLKNRIIPILLLKHGRCVKGKRFTDYRDTGAPITAARIYDAQRVDELVFLDILASREERDVLLNIVTETAQECFMPLTVGGGVKTIEDIKVLLSAGADKVSINTAAIEEPAFLEAAAGYFGRANIVAAVDYKLNDQGKREVFSHGGTKATGKDPFEWAKEVARLGAGELIVTSIDQEGTMTGYDLEFIKLVSEALSIPVIAHGGVGTLKDLKEGITIGRASGVAAASIFHFTDQSPIKARLYLKDNGVNVRI
ncbi:MAG: imidazole glycerol phosphate synthase cyclase subunit [Candidatus Margulisbacteria bacterium]|nr:imidazole glycerol phosphate synthase cyclase subunit [Candidatus Margulisiibacteriota bacterium]